MKKINSYLKDCFLIEPDIHQDKRGFFMELFNKDKYLKMGIDYNFFQDNYSYSTKGVLRGMHFQKQKPQGKLVSVIIGEVYDVVVDLRKNSSTFGKWEGFYLSSDNKKQLWVPPGFAHGFVVVSDLAGFLYKCSNLYDPADEGCILWNDPDLDIKWPDKNPIISEKDQNGSLFSKYK